MTTTTTSMGATTAVPPTQEKKTKILTLLFVRRTHPTTGAKEVLLGMKKRGFGQGKWNGFGGKVEPGETIEAAALRELEEESCLKASAAELRGKITFTFLTIPEILKVHVFEAVGPIAGEPQETEEMLPQWYAEKDIPYDKMWADDQYWVPLFLEGKRFKALFEVGGWVGGWVVCDACVFAAAHSFIHSSIHVYSLTTNRPSCGTTWPRSRTTRSFRDPLRCSW